MRNHLVVVLLSSLGLFACAGSNRGGEERRGSVGRLQGDVLDGGRADARRRATRGSAKKDTEGEERRAHGEGEEPKAGRRASKGTVNGESLSTISVDVADRRVEGRAQGEVRLEQRRDRRSSTRSSRSSSRAHRPDRTPGREARAERPADRVAEGEERRAHKSDAGWYDEEADVLVFVNASARRARRRRRSPRS